MNQTVHSVALVGASSTTPCLNFCRTSAGGQFEIEPAISSNEIYLKVCGLSWSTDGSTLASGGNDNLLCLWDASTSGIPKRTLSYAERGF